MKNKILFTGLTLMIGLFLWQQLTTIKSTPTTIPMTVSTKGGEKKSTFISTSITVSQSLGTAKNTVTTKHQLSHTQILSLLTKAKGNKELDAVAFLLKAKSCPKCLNSLKQILTDSMQSETLRTNAALVLAKIGSQESVIALIQSLHENSALASEASILQKITSKAIHAISEPEGIGALAYVLTDQQEGIAAKQLAPLLKNDMTKAIASYTDKGSVAYEITKQYWNTQNPTVQKAIVGLNHPQTLALLAMDAEELGNSALKNNMMQKLLANASGDSLDSLMSLVQGDKEQDIELSTQIKQWTQAHVNTDWQGHLIDYLSNPEKSTAQREIAATSLKNIIQTPNLVSKQESLQIQQILNKYQPVG